MEEVEEAIRLTARISMGLVNDGEIEGMLSLPLKLQDMMKKAIKEAKEDVALYAMVYGEDY